jgi:hypothetical protein
MPANGKDNHRDEFASKETAMGWKFWRKNDTATAASVGKAQKLARPRDLPQAVGRHLVVVEGLEPDWAWSLKCVIRSKDSLKNTFDIRIFSSETAAQHGVTVRDFTSLGNHIELVVFEGSYNKETGNVQLQRLIKEAV